MGPQLDELLPTSVLTLINPVQSYSTLKHSCRSMVHVVR